MKRSYIQIYEEYNSCGYGCKSRLFFFAFLRDRAEFDESQKQLQPFYDITYINNSRYYFPLRE